MPLLEGRDPVIPLRASFGLEREPLILRERFNNDRLAITNSITASLSVLESSSSIYWNFLPGKFNTTGKFKVCFTERADFECLGLHFVACTSDVIGSRAGLLKKFQVFYVA